MGAIYASNDAALYLADLRANGYGRIHGHDRQGAVLLFAQSGSFQSDLLLLDGVRRLWDLVDQLVELKILGGLSAGFLGMVSHSKAFSVAIPIRAVGEEAIIDFGNDFGVELRPEAGEVYGHDLGIDPNLPPVAIQGQVQRAEYALITDVVELRGEAARISRLGQ